MNPEPPSPSPAPDPEDDRRELLDGLVFDCLERVDAEDGAFDRVIEAACLEHPELASDLHRRVAALRAMGLIDGSTEIGAEEFPEQLGDFRLIRRLGSGGMGVVYLAEQRSMGRLVGLKLLRPEQIYMSGARRRFRREVEAIARLSHPGIVVVHTVGEERGVPFLSMDYVVGCSLDRVLDTLGARPPRELDGEALRAAVEAALAADGEEGPFEWDAAFWKGSWTEVCLRLVRQVAEALEHAHGRGVLHRDVKPSNVMVTPTGRALLLDFGLASLEGADSFTRTGAQIGSLPYMSPEQVEGRLDDIDRRSDVYSLGVTLYELLTLRSPYLDPGSSERTLRSILAGHPVPPRRHDPRLSADVQTVCLTAMDRDPLRRYPAAGEFATDLTNLLEARPISARPTGHWIQLRRWSRRRPGAAAATALVLLTATVGPTGYAFQEAHALVRVSTQRDRAEANFDEALAAIELLTRVAQDDLADVPGASEARRDLLEAARDFFESQVLKRVDDAGLRQERARALARLGRIEDTLGEVERAEGLVREAIGLLETSGISPELGQAWYSLGLILERSRRAEAIEAFGTAREVFEELAIDGEDHARRYELANVHCRTGQALRMAGEDERAEAELLKGIGDLEALTDGPDADRCRTTLGWAHNELGVLYAHQRRSEEMLGQYLRALAIHDALLEGGASSKALLRELVNGHSNVGGALQEKGESGEAESHLVEAVRLGKELTDRFPGIPEYRASLAGAGLNLGTTYLQQDRVDEALDVYREALDHLRRLVADQPENATYRERLAIGLTNLGAVHLGADEFELALATLDEVGGHLKRLLVAEPRNTVLLQVRHFTALNQMKAHLALGSPAEVVSIARDLPPPPDGMVLAHAASYVVGAFGALLEDEELSDAARADLELESFDLALSLLSRALDMGFQDADLAARERFGPLRDEPEFAELLELLAGR